MSEGAIQDAIRLALSDEPGLVLWRNNVGVAEHYGKRGVTFTRYGLAPGSADLVGVLNGRFFALEVKTATGRVGAEQRLWMNLVRSVGGFAAVARSVEDARAAVVAARAEGSFQTTETA